MHVVEAPGIGLLLPDRVRGSAGVGRVPGVLGQLAHAAAEAVLAARAGPAGIFPLGLRGQPIPIGVEVAHPRVLVVAGFEPLGQRPVVAVEGRIGPVDLLQRMAGPFEVRRVGDLMLPEFFLHDLVAIHPEGLKVHLMRRLLVSRARVAAHLERPAWDKHHLDAALGRDDHGGRRECSLLIAATARQDQEYGQKTHTHHYRVGEPFDHHSVSLGRAYIMPVILFLSS